MRKFASANPNSVTADDKSKPADLLIRQKVDLGKGQARPAMPVRAAGLVVFRRVANDIQYLMMQTSYGEHHWTPPKGHVDPGENDLQTALRETEEEAGLKETHFRIVENFRKELHYPVKGKPKVVVYWLSELLDPKTEVKLSREHQAFEWAEIDRACELAKYQDLQGLLKECHSFLQTI